MRWRIGAQVVSQGSRFLASVVLARLLAPSEFGLIEMTLVFTGLAGVFTDFGFSSALIQREEIEERHYSSVFWLNVIIGLLLAGLMVTAAPLVGWLYQEPRLVPIIMVVAVSVPVVSLSLVQKAILSRAMDFQTLGLIEMANAFISGVVAIVLALSGFGVWSLILQLLVSSILTTAGTWWMTSWQPRWRFDRAAVVELLGFSANQLGFSIVAYCLRNVDNLLVGKYLGSGALGIYARSYNLMLLPLSQVTWVISSVMFPVLSRLQNDKAQARSIYLRMVGMIALVTFPVMLGLLAVTDHFILAIYGTAWAGMIPVLRIFCILGMLQSIYTTVGLIFQSQGRTDRMFWLGSFTGTFSIGGILVGIWIGTLEAIATCLLITSIILLPHTINIPGQLIGITLGDVAGKVSSVFACAIAMAGSAWALGALLPSGWPHWGYLALQVPFGTAMYGFLIHHFQLVSYQELKAMLHRRGDQQH